MRTGSNLLISSHIYRLFNVNKKKWRPKGRFPNQPKMANIILTIYDFKTLRGKERRKT